MATDAVLTLLHVRPSTLYLSTTFRSDEATCLSLHDQQVYLKALSQLKMTFCAFAVPSLPAITKKLLSSKVNKPAH